MDLTMSIASMSMGMSSAKIQQQADISILKKAMNAEEASMNTLLEGMSQSIPSTDHIIDVFA